MDDTQSYPLYQGETGEGEIYIPMRFHSPSRVPRPTDLDKTLQEALADNLDKYVECELLIGTQNTVHKEGVLYDVGTGYFVLYHPEDDVYETCDFYSLKFMKFFRDDPMNMTQQPRRRR